MKATAFYILIHIRTAGGFESIGKFFIGDHRGLVASLFDSLAGNPDVDETTMLTMELMETRHGLPVNLNILGCTLQELADNCRIITREIFKAINLEELH